MTRARLSRNRSDQRTGTAEKTGVRRGRQRPVCPPNTDVTFLPFRNVTPQWTGLGVGRARSPSVAQRSTGDRFIGARNRTRYLPSECQLARLVEQLSRLRRGG